MPVLHLVRHGESEWNLAGRVQGQSAEAGSLTARGLRQAAQAARLLAERYPDIDAIFSSDLPRARETAEVIASVLGLPVRTDPCLREQHLGCLEGRRFADPLGEGTVQDAVERLWREPWRRPGDGESITDLYERVHATLDRYAAGPGREVVLVAHGGPVRVATTSADPRRREPVPRVTVGNATVTTVDRSRCC
ncbi:putative phosphoglycerate mutase [Amycolatopsis bartoniae]|uniref:Phosphoglycerate mutase n=1 Tax=Amycolatopsis bartoniae TaxID=941986 RepID=A0A8H9IS39_9PSEU|nr:histidine phosphatase family protein [Amycolatopsis bartoniae]MBB2939567.1 putative phosphoglycerate mutase [Amycolatopsis bartoniae]TVT07779.1 histidine phosphatase family protein [Amycolatopsis bartoniae]GHF39260.1 phosphoglycerate mutase [Amycolatopsis bartoniae]